MKNVYNNVSSMRSWSEHISSKQIKILTVGGMLLFYFLQFLIRPGRLVSVILRIIKNEPLTINGFRKGNGFLCKIGKTDNSLDGSNGETFE